MNEKEYDRLIDDYTGPTDGAGVMEGGGEAGALLNNRGSGYGTGSLQMSEMNTAVDRQRPSQRQGKFQGNASDIERISALPQQ